MGVSEMNQMNTVIFLHIAKNAGTSLRKILERFYEKREIYLIYTKYYDFHDYNDFKALPVADKMKLRIIYGHFSYGLHQEMPKPCIYVTMLRNPIDRMISLFAHASIDGSMPYREAIKKGNMGLVDFIRSGIASEADNHQTRVISGMSPKVGECSREMLELAKQNLEKHFAVVGLAEYFEESMVLMKNTLGWKMPFYRSFLEKVFYKRNPNYEKTNVSVDRKKKEELSEEEITTIKKFNELDMELYNHVQSMFHSRIRQQGELFRREVHKMKSRRLS